MSKILTSNDYITHLRTNPNKWLDIAISYTDNTRIEFRLRLLELTEEVEIKEVLN